MKETKSELGGFNDRSIQWTGKPAFHQISQTVYKARTVPPQSWGIACDESHFPQNIWPAVLAIQSLSKTHPRKPQPISGNSGGNGISHTTECFVRVCVIWAWLTRIVFISSRGKRFSWLMLYLLPFWLFFSSSDANSRSHEKGNQF